MACFMPMVLGMWFLAGALSLVIGVTLGLLGGGGSILTLPMLVYVMSVDAKPAIASSLFVVGVTSFVGTLGHARAGRVKWHVGGLFGISGMAGAFAGGKVAAFVPGTLLLLGFGAMMLLTSFAMIRGRREGADDGGRPVSVVKALALGASVGFVAGMVGAGGGFLVVPSLVLIGGLAMKEAVATSLLVITMQSVAGFAGHVTHVALDWPLLAVVTGAAVVGSLFGARLTKRFAPATLRKAFGWLVLAMGLFLLIKNLPFTRSIGPS